jgi:cell division protein FtsA
MTNIYAAIELGTTQTVLAVGEAKTGERLKIIRHAEINSSGVRKSQILNIRQATQSIKSIVKAIEQKQNKNGDSLNIGNAFLVVSGQHIKVDPYCSSVQVEGSKVTNRDIEEVERASQMMILPKERETLDIIYQMYGLDALEGISSPKGMSGRMLRLNTLHIHGDTNRINDARTAASEANLELRDPLFAVSCAADAVLNDSEKRDGTLVLDLGGGSTGYAVYFDGYLAAANAIGIGGDHISSDIAYAFQTTHAQSEELKKKEASAILLPAGVASARVQLPGSSPLIETRTISRRALDTVVNLRLKELFAIIRRELEAQDLLHRLHSGIVLTGGGAALKGLDALVQKEFGLPVRLGRPIHIDGLSDVPNPEAFAAISGALMFAHRNYECKPLISIFKGFFK